MPLPLLAELQRRRVFRALVVYGVVAFAVLQIIEPVMHGLHWSESVLSYVVVALAGGFPVVVGLAWVFDVSAVRTGGPAPVAEARGARRVLLWVALVGIGVLAAAPGLGWYFLWSGRGTAASQAARVPSIAVLPFVNLSSDPQQEYFSDGLAEEILDALAQVEGLHVVGRTSSFSFKGKSDDLRSIGQKLDVAHLLEGSVRKEGNRVRVTAQLVNALDGFHLWSKTFDRELTGVFAVEEEISRAVVEALKVRLVPGQRPRPRTARPEVYDEYLLGKQFFHRLTMDNYRRAAAAYERALALDPGFAPAWAGLSMATFWIADIAETSAAIAQGYDRALASAEKAIALDPELAEGYAVRGHLRSSIKWDWEGARADSAKALALNPGDPQNHRIQAVAILLPLGRISEAVGEARKAIELDPLSPIDWFVLGRLYLTDGQFAAAQAALERSLRILPEQDLAASNLAFALLLQGHPSDALAAARESSNQLFRWEGEAMVLKDLGRIDEARSLVEQMIARYAHSGAYQIAEVYGWFGESDRAFDWLERAYAQHDSGMLALKNDVLLRGLRDDPRFAALLKRMNLPPG